MKLKPSIIVTLILTGIIVTSCMNKKVQKANLAIDPANMDTTVNPGDDFFHYVNGGWIEANPIGDEYSQYGAFTVLIDENRKILNDLVAEVSKQENVESGSAAQKIRDFYNAGMDSVKIDELGYQPIVSYLERIEKIKDIKGVQNEIAQLHKNGIGVLFGFYGTTDPANSEMIMATYTQGGLGLPDVEYYTGDDDRSKEIREKYVEHIARMFILTGFSEEEAKKKAETIMKLETNLAKNSLTRLERRDPIKTYNRMTVDEFADITPELDWNGFYEILGTPDFSDVNIRMPEFYKAVNSMMKKVSVEDWKSYLEWNIINRNANFLSAEIEKADFDFYRGYLSGVKEMKPRWERIMNYTSGYLGEPIGKLYIEKYFPPAAKERMVELVGNLRYALGARIKGLEWMSDSTKQKALEKLAAMRVQIGYPDPDHWIDYSPFIVVEGDYLTNIMNGRKFYSKKNIDEIGKPVNRDEWIMSPQTVNAGYIPSYNQLVFPAGILQPPFFYMDADDAVNYGAIGVVIGHEMTHGFDDKGRLYDLKGNLENWWTDDDGKRFEEQSQSLIDQFDNFIVLDSLHVNGELTLGENIADNGGMNVSWMAFRKASEGKANEDIMGFTPEQRFFLSYAQLWRQTIRDEEMMRRLKEDVHSPGIARVNGAVVNIDPFYLAFDIQPDDRLFVAKEERANVW